jgi:hypothetical protein
MADIRQYQPGPGAGFAASAAGGGRRWVRLLITITVILLAGTLYLVAHFIRSVPSYASDPDELVLFSIDGNDHGWDPGKNPTERNQRIRFYGFPVLGYTHIADPAVRREVVAAVKKSMRFARPQGARCFNPRHVLRVSKGEETVDLVICYECGLYHCYRNGQTEGGSTILEDSQPLLDKILTDAGIRLAPKQCPSPSTNPESEPAPLSTGRGRS